MTDGITISLGTIVTLGGLLMLVGPVFIYVGRLTSRVTALEGRQVEILNEIRALREDLLSHIIKQRVDVA